VTVLAKLPRRSVQAWNQGVAEPTFEGVGLIDVLHRAGVRFGDGLRGKRLALYLERSRLFLLLSSYLFLDDVWRPAPGAIVLIHDPIFCAWRKNLQALEEFNDIEAGMLVKQFRFLFFLCAYLQTVTQRFRGSAADCCSCLDNKLAHIYNRRADHLGVLEV
jgi:hypothetical protein